MNWIDEIRSDIAGLAVTPKSLKKFGNTMGIVSVLFLCYAWLKGWGRTAEAVFVVLAAALFLFARMFPKLLRRPYIAWMSVAFVLGSVVSRVILCILFFVVITPVAVAARFFGKRFLPSHRDAGKASYWITRDPAHRIDYEKMH